MTRLATRLFRMARAPRLALLIFTVLMVGTVGAVLGPHLARGGGGRVPPVPPAPPATTPVPFINQDPQGVKVTGTLSQSKFVQGENGVVYVNLDIDTPAMESPAVARRATDMIVVLDRSGSMAADNKLPYAKEAVRNLIGRLQADDRFALIIFDSTAVVHTALVPMSDPVREQLSQQIASIRPGASTNLSDGLLKARAFLEGHSTERSRRVLLLSDGEANAGIVAPQELAKIVASFSKHGAVVSTIGMGLGFNESLMASLADYGMGNYSYLEHLSTLGDILHKDLQDAKQVFASASGLSITLGKGITITDAGGYPMDLTAQPGTARIMTGQLLAGTRKRFVVTLQVPTAYTGDLQLGQIALQYTTNRGDGSVTLSPDHLRVAVLEPARKDEAVASIDQTLYRQLWEGNNLGRMQKEFSHWLRLGDEKKAKEAVSAYRETLRKEEAATGVPLQSPVVTNSLTAMESDLRDAFSGTAPEQAEKRNRTAKDHHQKSVKGQRAN
jgi:Ca-activated chloride channel homolog